MVHKRRSFSPEYKDEAAKLVIEQSKPVASVARDIGVNEQTLRNWVNAYRRVHADEEPPLSVSERARLGSARAAAATGLRTRASTLHLRPHRAPRSGNRRPRETVIRESPPVAARSL